MIRNWLIIRAILLEEDLSPWELDDVLGHYSICFDRGLLHGAMVVNKTGANIEAQSEGLTAEGHEFAYRLRDRLGLEKALEEIDRRGQGPYEELLFDTLAGRL